MKPERMRSYEFNAIIEGSSNGKKTLNYRLVQLGIPEDAKIIKDPIFRYELYGRTTDFSEFERLSEPMDGIEARTAFLGNYKGVTAHVDSPAGDVVVLPRAVFMRDGRIFVAQHQLNDDEYLSSLSNLILSAKPFFRESAYSTPIDNVKGK